jgi:hypothetical protein
MSTVCLEIAERIAAGEFDSDGPTSIILYDNAWGGQGYGVIFRGQFPEKYAPSPFIKNPRVWWTKEGGKMGVE